MRSYQLAIALLVSLSSCAPPFANVGPVAGEPQEGEGSPAWIVEQYFLKRTFPRRGSFLTGEVASGPTVGSQLPADAAVTLRPVATDTNAAVFGVTIHADGTVDDVYAYLESRNGKWRLGAIRGLALPRLYYMMLDSLRSAEPLPDSLKPMLASMQLTVASDSALRDHFRRHREGFHRLARDFLSSGADLIRDDGRTSPAGVTVPGLPEQLRELLVESAIRAMEDEGCILLSIGGMIDNHVGYLFAPPGCTVPVMSPHHYILVEEIEQGWYLYKTT